MAQRPSFEQLHGDKGLTFVLADVVNGADVGMVKRGGGVPFAAEALERLRVLGEVLRQDLQGNQAAEPAVLRLIYHTHTAAIDLIKNTVVIEGLADRHRVRRPLMHIIRSADV